MHHIVARKTLREAEYYRPNGVTLCKSCHKKTDSFGGGKDITPYNRRGKILKFILKVIPHHWQDYSTVGNYFYVGKGTFVVFCSDMNNEKYHSLVFSHEMIEASLVLERGISLMKIDNFDMKFEMDRLMGKHLIDEEPGDDPNAPYFAEHQYATLIERQLAKIWGVDWGEYSNKVNSL